MIITIKKLSYFILLCGFILPNYLHAATSCKQWVAKVSSAQGKVQVKPYNQEAWQSVLQNAYLCGGDAIKTGKDSRVILEFANQAVATIDQNATLIFPQPQIKAESWLINLIEGSGFFRSRRDQDLEIETPFINCVHKGTEFLINVGPNSAKITVFDGEVAAKNQLGDILIKQGYSGGAQSNQAPKVYALTAKPEEAVQWTLYYPPVADYQNNVFSSTEPWLNPAVTAYQQGNLSTAIDLLRDLPKVQRNADAMTLEASLLLTVGRLDEAQPLINQAQKIAPHNSMAMALKSVISVAQNQSLLALQQAQQATEFDPKSATAQIALSYAYQSQFKVEEALKAAQQATALAPNNALAWARLSELQLSVGNRNTALASAQKAQVLNPKLPRIQTIQGFANLAENNIADGSQNFRQAIALDSSDPIARLGLGLAKIRQGQLEDGKSDLEIAVNLDPNNSILRSYLGKAFYELKNQEYSEKEFSLAKAMDANDPTPWFYDAILKQTTNRPIEALHDMQKAIALNDNRGVYRSSLLLDKDLAARSAAQGRIYNELGFQQQGLLEGWKSVNRDDSNYSAHRLLADNYAALPRHEIARVSELLQSQLLQPVNITPIQPNLSESNLFILNGLGASDLSFNEFNPLFEYNRLALQASGLYGGNNTWGDNVTISGIKDNLSFNLGQSHYQTDGFRDNNSLKKDLYNAFIQGRITEKLSLQAEYQHEDKNNGDLRINFDNKNYFKNFNETKTTDNYRLGGHYEISPNASVIGSLIYQEANFHQDRKDIIKNPLPPFIDPSPFLEIPLVIDSSQNGFIAELQHNYHTENFSSTNGFSHINQERNQEFTHSFKQQINNINTSFYDYSKIAITHNLKATVGLSFNHFSDDINGEQNPINPKLGLEWSPSPATTLRAAVFRALSVTRASSQTIEPTQVAGFNQLFDDVDGTVAWRFGIGADHKFSTRLSAGFEYSERKLDLPIALSFDSRSEQSARGYIYLTPTDQIALSTEYFYERINQPGSRVESDNAISLGLFDVVKTHRIPLTFNWFHPSGFSLKLKSTYVNQTGTFQNINNLTREQGASDFFIFDLGANYRLPNRHGIITVGVNNIFDNSVNYQNTNFNELTITPSRLIFSRFTISF